MKEKFTTIWNLALPYLHQAIMKDFEVHTQGVVKAMELLIAKEGGDENILIPAAILHDVGFSKVSKELQTNGELEKKREAQRQHLIYCKDIIKEILTKVGYSSNDINKVIEVVKAHKFQDPDELAKRLLIDADNLSDTFHEQFYSDVKTYGFPAKQVYDFRTRNTYYTKTANQISALEMTARFKEIEGAKRK